ncbi:hypothetical protein [Clostridium sp.]|nr:hypothetical protein [Clostridium sp.]
MEDYSTSINSDLFNSDIDDLQFEPEVIKSDNDEELNALLGY